MIADTVAGIDRLCDPGNKVTTESTSGTITDSGLRKSRLDLGNGDRLVLADRDIENKWTKIATGDDKVAA